MESQGTQGGVASGTATPNERFVRIDQALLAQIRHRSAGIHDVYLAPALVQGLAVSPSVARAATVIQVGDGEAALSPVLNARVEHGVAGGGRATVDEDQQRGEGIGGVRRVEETMRLCIFTGIREGAGLADARVRQYLGTTRQHVHHVAASFDGDDGRRTCG